MNRMAAAVIVGAAGTVAEIALLLAGAPLLLLAIITLALVGTVVLSSAWHPIAILTSAGLYLGAVALGVVSFSYLGLAFAGLK